MRQARTTLSVRTPGQGLHEITAEVGRWVAASGIGDGLLIQENADPDVVADLNDFFRRLVPEGGNLYRHAAEGADDMPAHIRAALTLVQISLPVDSGRLGLGTWQGLYLFEHRSAPHQRRVVLHLLGN